MQCSGHGSLAAAHVCMHAKLVYKVQSGQRRLFSYTLMAKVHCVASIFSSMIFAFLYVYICINNSTRTCCFPTIHRLAVWFMNSMTWPGPLRKMWADEGILEVRWAVGGLLLQRRRHVWRLCPDNSVAASSHENFQGGRGRCTTQPQYRMKNLSEVAIRACYIR